MKYTAFPLRNYLMIEKYRALLRNYKEIACVMKIVNAVYLSTLDEMKDEE